MTKKVIGARGKSVSLRGVSKHFSGVTAVNNVNLEIESGGFVTLLGPSGSGKTTTLMMIAGFVFPDTGEIFIGDQSVTLIPTFRRNLGMVFQSYSLFPNMNVFQNIAFPLEMRGIRRSEIKARVSSALEMVHLSGYEDRRANQLSGGQQQRVALARALIYEPSVLLLDEPLGALDLKLRQEMQIEILQLYRRLGITIILVTHDQSEALTMSGRIVVIDNGAIQQVGTPDEVYRRPANKFVADFIGESNFISGETSTVGSHMVLHTQDGLRLLCGGCKQIQPASADQTVCLRPESISVVGTHGDCDNVFEGRIVEVFYLGDVVRYIIKIGPQTTVTAKWLMNTSTEIMKPGDIVRIGWSVADMVQV